jgi:hypothetical protein
MLGSGEETRRKKIRDGKIYELFEFVHVLNLVQRRFLMQFSSRFLRLVVCGRRGLEREMMVAEKVQQRKFDFCHILCLCPPRLCYCR